jgi:hypothetical protein
MSVKQELIRWIFGTLAAPAFIENLMTKFDIGIDGSSDRTRFIVKDSFGVQHDFITEDETDSKIDVAISSNLGAANFVELDDVPVSYVGEANKVLKVNGTESALEYADMIEDENGHIAYKDTAIPSGLSTDYMYEFSGLRCRASTTLAVGQYTTSWDCHNCYPISLTDFNFIDDSEPATITRANNGNLYEYTIPDTESNGFTGSDYERKRTDVNGNIAYNRAAIPLSLNVTLNYEFRGLDCYAYAFAGVGAYITSQGCYPNAGASSYTSKITGGISVTIKSIGKTLEYSYDATTGEVIPLASFLNTKITDKDGRVYMYGLKEGTSQVDAGADAYELWVHDDGPVMRGI